jgi:triacylglycerol lipase
MGGLDARHALAKIDGISDRVETLVTIGTPHLGSPVADAILKHTGPLWSQIPPFLSRALLRDGDALKDLTTDAAQKFEESTPNMPGVRYIEMAGDASRSGGGSLLFKLAATIFDLNGEVNDGVVTRRSALRGAEGLLPDWLVDHAGEIGWSRESLVARLLGKFGLSPPPEHLRWYSEIVDML